MNKQIEQVHQRIYEMLTGGIGTAGSGPLGPPLTVEKILELKRQFEANPIPVGIVMRADLYAQAIALTEPADAAGLALRLPIYYDVNQEEPWKEFFDFDELRAYLNRNVPIHEDGKLV